MLHGGVAQGLFNQRESFTRAPAFDPWGVNMLCVCTRPLAGFCSDTASVGASAGRQCWQ